MSDTAPAPHARQLHAGDGHGSRLALFPTPPHCATCLHFHNRAEGLVLVMQIGECRNEYPGLRGTADALHAAYPTVAATDHCIEFTDAASHG